MHGNGERLRNVPPESALKIVELHPSKSKPKSAGRLTGKISLIRPAAFSTMISRWCGPATFR